MRPLLLAGAGIGLVLVLVAGLLLAGPAWQQLDMDSRVSTAETWTVEQWTGLEEGAGEFMDQLFLRYYDRRAPAQPTSAPHAGAVAGPNGRKRGAVREGGRAMSRAAKRLGRDERGQSLVEMTFVVGLLLLLVAGTVDLGRAFHTYIVLTNAAREGARWGSHYPWDGPGIVAAARGEAADSGVDLATSSVTVSGGGGTGGDPIAVLVEHSYDTFLGGFMGMGSLTLRTRAEMIIFGLDD